MTHQASARTDAKAADATMAELVDSLAALRARLGAVRLPLELPGAEAAREDVESALYQIDSYLLPRLSAVGAPLVVVVGGSTGAGKSTLINSLLGSRICAPGVLRPTTRTPVLVHSPLDDDWFAADRKAPSEGKNATSDACGPRGHARRGLRVETSPALPPGLALVDSPDIDSVDTVNRELAEDLLATADLWLFVTTAARYADAVPWNLLHQAARRRTEVALVLDRVDAGAQELVADMRRMMNQRGLADAPLFWLPAELDDEGLVPCQAIADLAAWLTALGADGAARLHVVRATCDGLIDDLLRRCEPLADAADEQVAADGRLREAVDAAYGSAISLIGATTSNGAMLRGEVLTRWQDLVGGGKFFQAMQNRIGLARDAITGFFTGRAAQAPRVEASIALELRGVVLDALDGAAEQVYAIWHADPAGRPLLRDPELARASARARGEVERQIRAWQGDVLDMVRADGASKRGTARALALGVNGLGVSLMVVVFASTGGLTGAELGIAGGTAVVAQKVLEAVFGDDAVRRLTIQARHTLQDRVDMLVADEMRRYVGQLDAVGAGGLAPASAALRECAATVAQAAARERAARVDIAPHQSGTGSTGALRGAELASSATGVASPDVGIEPGEAPAPCSDRASEPTLSDRPTRVRSWWRRVRGKP